MEPLSYRDLKRSRIAASRGWRLAGLGTRGRRLAGLAGLGTRGWRLVGLAGLGTRGRRLAGPAGLGTRGWRLVGLAGLGTPGLAARGAGDPRGWRGHVGWRGDRGPAAGLRVGGHRVAGPPGRIGSTHTANAAKAAMP